MVIWLIGLSAAGKTTVGRLLADRLKAETDNLVFLDGDLAQRVADRDRLVREPAGDALGPLQQLALAAGGWEKGYVSSHTVRPKKMNLTIHNGVGFPNHIIPQ